MNNDLQKASFWKRMSAYLFDIIILGVLVTLIAFALSALLGYDAHSKALTDAYAKYEQQYGVTFEITQAEFEAMSPEDMENYNNAYAALIADDGAIYAYNMVMNLTLVILSISILLGYLILEFAIPLWLGNGQTLGKKIFGICLMRTDSVKITTVQLFIRTVLGKYTIGTMVPVFILIMLYFNIVGLFGTVILMGLAIGQVLCLAVSANRSAIHDLLAGTTVVDYASQRIFRTTEDLIAYKKMIHAEEVSRKKY